MIVRGRIVLLNYLVSEDRVIGQIEYKPGQTWHFEGPIGEDNPWEGTIGKTVVIQGDYEKRAADRPISGGRKATRHLVANARIIERN